MVKKILALLLVLLSAGFVWRQSGDIRRAPGILTPKDPEQKNFTTLPPAIQKDGWTLQPLDTYRLDVGVYPTSDQGLNALVAKPDGVDRWQGPYLQKQVPGDPWGRAYKYKSPGDHSDYDLYSYGSDNAPGGVGEAQDVNSWETTATIKTQ